MKNSPSIDNKITVTAKSTQITSLNRELFTLSILWNSGLVVRALDFNSGVLVSKRMVQGRLNFSTFRGR